MKLKPLQQLHVAQQKPKPKKKIDWGTGPTLDFEREQGFPRVLVAGVDEVGRGCLAGPVVAAAAILPDTIDFEKDAWLLKITDSKLLSEETRDNLAPQIQKWVKAFCIASASVEEIDRINIFHASHLAMERAVSGLNPKPAHVLVDGKFLPKKLPCPSTALIKGDFRSLSIACASIIAKVHRDQLMGELEKQYPGYGLAGHKGYPTPAHKLALKKLGATVLHRRSFGPVAEVLGVKLDRQLHLVPSA